MLKKEICEQCEELVNFVYYYEHEGWAARCRGLMRMLTPVLSTKEPPKDCPYFLEHKVETQENVKQESLPGLS